MASTESHNAIAPRPRSFATVRANRGYEFGPYRLDVLTRRLLKSDEAIALAPKAFDLLLTLIEQRHRAVDKAELMQTLWPNSFVEEANLTQTVFVLRKTLGETPAGVQYIETVARHGYRFAGEVREVGDELDAAPTVLPTSAKPTAPSIWHDRRGLTILIAVAAALVALAYVGFRQQNPTSSAATRQGVVGSLAVLPFKPLRPSGEEDYLGLGMTDTLITRLGNVRQITVRPTRSVLGFTKSDQDLVRAGRALGVNYVLDGSIQRVGERLRVNVQLVDVASGAPLWTEAFDERFTDIFSVQDSISHKVAEALLSNLTGRDREQLGKRYTNNIQAYQLYVQGRYHWNRRSEADLRRSIAYFEQALERDPTYALAYGGLADAYNMMANWSFMPAPEAYRRAQAAAAKALEIDRGLAEAEVALVFSRFLLDRDYAAAERGFREAIARSPGYAPAHQWYGIYLASIGEHERAASEVRRAVELEPLSSIINSVLSWVLYLGRRYDDAIEQSLLTLQMDPNYYAAHVYLGESYEAKGMYSEARASLERARAISGGRARDLGALGHLYAVSQKRAEALQVLQELERQSATAYVEPFYIALVHLGLGDNDRALDWLEESQVNGFPWMIHWNVSPRLDPLRRHPRFVALLRRAGLAQPADSTRRF